MYDGPVIDAFFHPPWSPQQSEESFGSRESWVADPMRNRVMRAFGQLDGAAARTPDKDLAATLKDMEESGVERAVLQASLYYPGTEAGLECRHAELGGLVKEYPDRFLATATVLPPAQGPGTYWDLLQNPRLLERAVARYGFRGVHLLPSPWGTPPNDRWFYPLYAKCVELNLVVFSYIGIPGPLWPMHPNYPGHLDDVCIAFPELRVVGHHIGDPWVEMMTHLAGKHENLYICTSAWSPKRYPPALLEFMRGKWHGTAGADKVLFGTDYPLLNLQKAVRDARSLDLPDDVLAKFLWRNTARLMWDDRRSTPKRSASRRSPSKVPLATA